MMKSSLFKIRMYALTTAMTVFIAAEYLVLKNTNNVSDNSSIASATTTGENNAAPAQDPSTIFFNNAPTAPRTVRFTRSS